MNDINFDNDVCLIANVEADLDLFTDPYNTRKRPAGRLEPIKRFNYKFFFCFYYFHVTHLFYNTIFYFMIIDK